MDKFYTATAGILLTVILVLVVRKQSSEIAVLLCLGGCCMALVVAFGFLRPVMTFVQRLQHLARLDTDMVRILMKVTAVAFTAEIASAVSADAGNGALSKSLQMLSAIVILYLSLPMLEAFLSLVEGILVAL